MNPYSYKISFRVTHPEMDLGELVKTFSQVFDLAPQRVWKKGDPRTTHKGTPLDGIHKDSYAYFAFFKDSQGSQVKELPEALEKIVEQITSQKPLLIECVEKGIEFSFFIGVFVDANSGLVFNRTLLKKLANLNIELQFDLYPPDESSKDDLEKMG